jgi:hypothetical protein
VALAAVVGVTDRAGWRDVRTDNLVVVDALRRRLVWVPRDLWSPVVRNRINRAYGLGGFPRLLAALWYLGLPVSHGLILDRTATERFAEGLDVVVPVEAHASFLYPMEPTRPIEEGWKLVRFDPPEERLRGERLHQWVGARYQVGGKVASDLLRIDRQQTLVRVLLETHVPLHGVLEVEDDVRRFRDPERVLRRVEATWPMYTYGPTHGRELEDGAQVLITPSAIGRVAARARALVLGGRRDQDATGRSTSPRQ